MYGFGGLGQVEVGMLPWRDNDRPTDQTKRKDRATQPLDHGRLR